MLDNKIAYILNFKFSEVYPCNLFDVLVIKPIEHPNNIIVSR